MVETKVSRVDYHVHFNEQSILDTFELAKKENVVALALLGRGEISDHIEECIKLGEKMEIKVIPGVEYVAKVNGSTTDLVALGFDYEHPSVRQFWAKDNPRQIQINTEVAEKQKLFLEGQGFVINGRDDDGRALLKSLLKGQITEKAINFCRLATNNPVNEKITEKLKAAHFVEWQEVRRLHSNKPDYKDNSTELEAKFIWYIFFQPGRPGFVPVLTESSRIIQAVHDAGGVVLYSPEGKFEPEIWQQLTRESIDGIMGWHAASTEFKGKFIREIVRSGLLFLGGSDYDPNKNHWQLGIGVGSMFISPRRHEELITLLRAKNKGYLPWEKRIKE